MDIKKLRRKYRQILESHYENDSSQDEQPQTSKTFFCKTRVQTEHSENLDPYKKKNNVHCDQVIIALKSRIAQGVKTLSEKDSEIAELQRQIIKVQEQVKLVQEQVEQERNQKKEIQSKLVEEKVKISTLEKNMKNLNKTIESQNIEKEMICTQIEFYKKEISILKKEKRELLKTMKHQQKENNKLDLLKSENSRLKDDIKRMQVIINECCNERVKTNLTDKHYVGKPLRESSTWVSQNLIGEVEVFLKKEQIGYGNKEFLNNLVKFINKFNKEKKKEKTNSKMTDSHATVRPEPMRTSSVRKISEEQSIKKTQILPCSALKRSLLISKLGKSHAKRQTQSFIIPEKDRKEDEICEKILNEYMLALEEAVNLKDIKSKTIMLLSQEMKNNILSVFSNSYI